MRAVVLASLEDKARTTDLPRPEIGDGECLVRVVAASINAFDWKVADGMMTHNFEYEFPVTIGRDFSGVVDESRVDQFAAGDEVFGYLSSSRLHDGSFAEYMRTRNACMAGKPEAVEHAVAAAIPLAGVTALRCVEPLQLSEGQSLLVVGAPGGVGSFIVQLAARAGARVLASGLPEDEEYLRELGAEVALARGDELERAVREHFPAGVDAAVDLVNRGEEFMRTARLVARGGAAVSTHGQAKGEAFDELGLTAVNASSQGDPTVLAALGERVASGEIRVPVSSSFPLERAVEGLAAARDEHVRGKSVVTVTG
jgi:NADPH2:quinone reductase